MRIRGFLPVGGVVVLGWMMGTGESRAEFSAGNDDGICERPYEIKSNGTVRGYLVVVAAGCTTHSSGFTPGMDHYTWIAGPAWPGSFILNPVSTTPAFSAYAWESYDAGHFDLETSQSFPSITPGADDEFYRVLEGDNASPPNLTPVAYLWLKDGSPTTQAWYGLDGVLTEELIGGPGVSLIKLQAVQVPAAGSLQVHPLVVP